ncbi:MAG TPA: hypothetical protein VF974_07465 [Patescibacteria group bacterium]
MNSLSTIQQANQLRFLSMLEQSDPALYMIKIALDETHVNPLVVIPVIRAISSLTYDGYGKVQIFMQARMITQIKPEASTEVNEPAIKS